MAENAPYEEEAEIEDEVNEELVSLLLAGVLDAVSTIKVNDFTRSDFEDVLGEFNRKASKALPTLSSASQRAIDVGVERAMSQIKSLKDLSVDHNDEFIQSHIRSVLNSNINQVQQTNRRAFNRVLEIGAENNWSDKVIAQRLKKYFGLVPSHIDTVFNMETSLLREGAKKSVVDNQVQKKIDQLVEWRLRLTSANIATDIVEGSKSNSFQYLRDEGQLNEDYVKQWVSVIDDRTSDVCLSSNRTIAEIGGTFSNGFAYPPAHGHCRSSIRIIKRPN